MVRSKEDIKKYQAEYRKSHKEQRKAYDQTRYAENKDFFVEKNAKYHVQNAEKRKEYKQNYYKNNREAVNKSCREYIKIRRNSDTIFNLRSQVSKNIARALKKNGSSKNGNSIFDFLPYTIQELKDHLEKQFEPWMSWDNWGLYNSKTWNDHDLSTWTWNIDHIFPQSLLPYSSMSDDNFRKCWALSNLRPYSAKRNIIDGNRR